MQRYFIAADQFMELAVRVTGDDAHHLTRVMRMNVGDQFIASNGIDREAVVRISSIDKGEVIADIVEQLPLHNEPEVEVWIAQSLPKGDKMDMVIQKCTEIGASRFIPFLSERTIVHYDSKKEAKRQERWQKIAKEAAEQAHRNRVPAVEPPITWNALMDKVKEADGALFCYEKEGGALLKPSLQMLLDTAAGPQRILVIVGPEGGFTVREAEAAEAAGCIVVGLGKRILRTETAAMVGLTCILYETGEMGGDQDAIRGVLHVGLQS